MRDMKFVRKDIDVIMEQTDVLAGLVDAAVTLEVGVSDIEVVDSKIIEARVAIESAIKIMEKWEERINEAIRLEK